MRQAAPSLCLWRLLPATGVETAPAGLATARAMADTFTFAPIGHIESCFRRLRAIPRQGALAPDTRARLVLRSSVQDCTCDELDQFTHLWVVFVFHDTDVSLGGVLS